MAFLIFFLVHQFSGGERWHLANHYILHESYTNSSILVEPVPRNGSDYDLPIFPGQFFEFSNEIFAHVLPTQFPRSSMFDLLEFRTCSPVCQGAKRDITLTRSTGVTGFICGKSPSPLCFCGNQKLSIVHNTCAVCKCGICHLLVFRIDRQKKCSTKKIESGKPRSRIGGFKPP